MKTACLMLSIALLSVAVGAAAQSDQHQHSQPSSEQKAQTQKAAAPKTEAEKSFDVVKSLAGEWQGKVKIDPPQPQWTEGHNPLLHLTMRVTSRGNAVVHELQEAGTPLDFTKYDHPVTMMYINDNQLNLIHYCDAGNRPRMVGKVSPDGKKVEFEFQDISGDTNYGHMHHAIFTYIDENHHAEDWTFMMPGDKPVHAHFDLQRTQVAQK